MSEPELERTPPAATAAAPPSPTSDDGPLKHPLALPHMRNLWIGSLISLLGDQFYLVAVPWLVLQLTGSGLALGTVLMTTAVPRAVLMLAGGAVTDRFSARRVLMVSTVARAILVGTVAALVWLKVIQLWHVYILTFAFGVADAFSLPAAPALIPTLVDKRQLGPANALMQGAQAMAQMAGPAPAGILIRVWGIAAALFVDALSFVGVLVALWRVPEPARTDQSPAGPRPRTNVLKSIGEGLRVVRDDPPLRTLMALNSALYLLIYGPIIVGLAMAAKVRFGSAAAFGTCMAFLSGGMLLGVLLGGRLKKPHHRGLQFIGMSALTGATLLGIGLYLTLPFVLAMLAVMGAGVGFVSVQFTSWVQGRVDHAVLGRVSSLLLFSALGLVPFSYAISGALAQWNLEGLYLLSGGLLLAASAAALASPSARAID